jgi:hypothetical protein
VALLQATSLAARLQSRSLVPISLLAPCSGALSGLAMLCTSHGEGDGPRGEGTPSKHSNRGNAGGMLGVAQLGKKLNLSVSRARKCEVLDPPR